VPEAVHVIATLRTPYEDEASRSWKPRPLPVEEVIAAIVLGMRERGSLRSARVAGDTTHLLVDMPQGASVSLSLRRDAFEVRVGPRLVDAHTEPSTSDYLDRVSDLLEGLQVISGFYVFGDDLVGFDPAGACPGCGVEVFEWQHTCDDCGAPLLQPATGVDELDARARRLVQVMVRREMIELATPRARKVVEETVSAFLEHGRAGAGVLLTLLIETEGVAEVYCDAAELARVLRRIA
jgi:hypothetical protein